MKLWQKIMLCIVIVGGTILIYKYYTNTQVQLKEAKNLSEQQATDIKTLQNKLDINKHQADALTNEIEKAQDNKMQPVTHITIEAPDVNTATKYVTEKINDKDDTMPPEVLEKTDRTVVAPQPQNKDYPVGVYKINLEKQHKIKAGATVINNKPYWSVGYQQNKMEIIIHGQNKMDGGTVMYTIKEW